MGCAPPEIPTYLTTTHCHDKQTWGTMPRVRPSRMTTVRWLIHNQPDAGSQNEAPRVSPGQLSSGSAAPGSE